jgi:hypothetical protein
LGDVDDYVYALCILLTFCWHDCKNFVHFFITRSIPFLLERPWKMLLIIVNKNYIKIEQIYI